MRIASFIACVVVASLFCPRDAAAQQTVAVPDKGIREQERSDRHTRWEYCEFTWKGPRFRLELPEMVVETDNMAAMLEKLGSKSKNVHTTAILNALGALGWELVSHQTFMNNGVQWQYWVFKRPELKRGL